MYEIELMGGRNDGMIVPVSERIWYLAFMFLVTPDGKAPTADGYTAHGRHGNFFFQADFEKGGDFADEPELREMDSPRLYFRCSDNVWRQLKAKRALGL
jgi:hypothetical protein